MNNINDTNNILFYDGDCGFCNSSVQFVLKNQKQNKIHFATLQSKFAQEILGAKQIEIKLDTLYYLKNNTIYSKSSAGLQLSSELKLPYSIFKLFYIVPKPLRDWIYTFIAKNRHKISNSYCILPTEEEKRLFIN